MRWVVTLSRTGYIDGEAFCDLAVIGPFRKRKRADERAATIRRLADTYEDPEGVTGPENALSVVVEPLDPGRTSAQDALDLLYGSVERDDDG